jgi:hypothetical protein
VGRWWALYALSIVACKVCAMSLREDGATQAFDSGHLPFFPLRVRRGRVSISGVASNNGCELALKGPA